MIIMGNIVIDNGDNRHVATMIKIYIISMVMTKMVTLKLMVIKLTGETYVVMKVIILL